MLIWIRETKLHNRATTFLNADPPNLHSDFAEAVVARLCRKSRDDIERPFPTVEDGVKRLAFVEAAVRSSASGRLEPLEYPPI
jgi:hypothetical protein